MTHRLVVVRDRAGRAQHRRLRLAAVVDRASAARATRRRTDTSHVWDGDITEYNKPLPRWWINLF